MIALALRFVLSALVLLFVGLLVPGFRVGGIVGALAASLVIALLGYAARIFLGGKVSPQGRGLWSFLLAAAILYAAQFLVPGYRASLVGALLASLVIGAIDAFIPTELR